MAEVLSRLIPNAYCCVILVIRHRQAAWLKGNRFTERRKRKCALTSTGLLKKGSKQGMLGATELAIVAARRSWREVFLWKTRGMKKEQRRKK
jgi:hypothetical protein